MADVVLSSGRLSGLIMLERVIIYEAPIREYNTTMGLEWLLFPTSPPLLGYGTRD